MKTQSQSPLAALLEGLNREQLQEFAEATDYLASLSQTGNVPERSGIGEILNRLSPAVREKFQLLSNVLETPRTQPFAPKLTESDYARTFGFDPALTETVKASMDGQEVMGRLQQRMGTDQPSNEPLSRRDMVEAAMAKHSKGA
jgi:hypothetical protein